MHDDHTEPHRIPELGEAFQTPASRVRRTALYVDQVGSTEMKAKVPEAQWVTTAAFINETINRVIAEIKTNSEVLVKWLGDGALLTFDASDVTHALNAGIRIQYAIKKANESRSIESFCSIGIATGWVFAFTTPNGTHDHLGTVMDRGARLCAAANANAIFIDHDTNAAADMTAIESPLGVELQRDAKEYLGEAERVTAKGFEQPLEYFELLWDKQRFSVKNKIETDRTRQPVSSPVRSAPVRSAATASAPRTGRQERRTGEIKVWLESRNCGFIRDPHSGEEFFFRQNMLVDTDDLKDVKQSGTQVVFVAKEATSADKCRQAVAIMVVGEYYEGDLVLPEDKRHGWIFVEDQQGGRHPVYLRDRTAFNAGGALSFRVTAGERGASAEDVALAAEDSKAA
jgi:class 3 adenylate cyclase/cold shock CspA family protein